MADSVLSRRRFLGWTSGLGLGSFAASRLIADDSPTTRSDASLPPTRQARATSGDAISQPNWDERLTVTVGQKSGDLIGSTHKVLQAAVDYIAQLGGGTVRILPGTYTLRGSVHLRSGVRLQGSGDETILTKPASVTTKLAADSDWFDQEITLSDSRGFELGDSVCLRTRNPHHGGVDILKRTLVARSGNRFKLDRPLRQNFWLLGESTCSTLFPLVSGEEIQQIAIENLTLDGNRANNEHLDGNYGGCIFLQDVNQVRMWEVTARQNNGDGISWQICHDVTVEDCRSYDHAGLGLHPGSGSQRPVMRRNQIERCQIGIFFCWGVKYGVAEENTVVDIQGQGISIGHRDTDNVVRRNIVRNSGQNAVLFRPERGAGFCGHRNLIEQNHFENSGPVDGVAIDVQGGTEQITLRQNTIRETREPGQRVGIRLGKETKQITVAGNRFTGLMQKIVQV